MYAQHVIHLRADAAVLNLANPHKNFQGLQYILAVDFIKASNLLGELGVFQKKWTSRKFAWLVGSLKVFANFGDRSNSTASRFVGIVLFQIR
jgi:hypothetical protein